MRRPVTFQLQRAIEQLRGAGGQGFSAADEFVFAQKPGVDCVPEQHRVRHRLRFDGDAAIRALLEFEFRPNDDG